MFGEKLRAEREKLDLSAQSLAEACGVARSYITLMESGKRLPGKPLLPKIATALNIPVEVILEWYFADMKDKIIKKQRLF